MDHYSTKNAKIQWINQIQHIIDIGGDRILCGIFLSLVEMNLNLESHTNL